MSEKMTLEIIFNLLKEALKKESLINRLYGKNISVECRALTAEEAIGNTWLEAIEILPTTDTAWKSIAEADNAKP